MLLNIEKNVEEAKDYIEKGEKELVEAKKWYQTGKCVCCLLEINSHISVSGSGPGHRTFLCV